MIEDSSVTDEILDDLFGMSLLPSQYYLLFWGWKDIEGGASDFHSAYNSLEEAQHAGIKYWQGTTVRLASWMHLAVFKIEGTPSLRVIANLHIPGAENCATEDRVKARRKSKLHWIMED